MYAVIVTGGKQYRVAEGDVVRVEKLPVEEGGTVEIDKVLMVTNGDDVKVGGRSPAKRCVKLSCICPATGYEAYTELRTPSRST